MTDIRLVENELEDATLWVVAGLLDYAYEESGCSTEEYLFNYWTKDINSLRNDSLFAGGKHIEDSVLDVPYCKRCEIEKVVDQAKELIKAKKNENS